MPFRLDIKRKLTARSDRVKCVDHHSTEPWILVSLYNGHVHVWNHRTVQLIKSFEVSEAPVRTAKFVSRKNWVVAGSDDMNVHVFNYNTLAKTHSFNAHGDYIRSIAINPEQPFVLTSSDDMLIKLWDWDKQWSCQQVFEGHRHYVMQVIFNPKDSNTFASASLDRTIKVWQLGSNRPNFTLEGHDKGINCIDYYQGSDKPYLISGADDRRVKIWDYQTKSCLQTLRGHAHNISTVNFHPELPIIITGSEDGTVHIWHASTYRAETVLNYGLERVWALCCVKGSNNVVIGYDEGCIMIQLGKEEPAISMDSSGKIIWAKHSELQRANLKAMVDGIGIEDGQRLPLAIKDMGSCEIYPQVITHSPNGRFVAICGDEEYIIYTAMALRSKGFGQAREFVWSSDSSMYAVRDAKGYIKVFKDFKETKSLGTILGAESIFGGFLLGVRSPNGLTFYGWESLDLIRRIDILPKLIVWSENAGLVCITTDDSYFMLKYNADAIIKSNQPKAENGIIEAFDFVGEVKEMVKTAIWIGDSFIYTNSVNRLNYYVGGEVVTISHLDSTMYLLGYIPKDSRLYLGDKELNVVSFSLLLPVLEYQTAVMRSDFETANSILPVIPLDQRTRVAHFLEKRGFKVQALAVSTDHEHRFELALDLQDLRTAHQLAQKLQMVNKWQKLAESALSSGRLELAQDCLHNAGDYDGLLLLATCAGSTSKVEKLGELSDQCNIAFLSNFLVGKLEKCLEILIGSSRLPEAAFFARTYCPSQISRVVALWKASLAKVNLKASEALADPAQYANLFPGLYGETEPSLASQDSFCTDRNQDVPVETNDIQADDGQAIYETPIDMIIPSD